MLQQPRPPTALMSFFTLALQYLSDGRGNDPAMYTIHLSLPCIHRSSCDHALSQLSRHLFIYSSCAYTDHVLLSIFYCLPDCCANRQKHVELMAIELHSDSNIHIADLLHGAARFLIPILRNRAKRPVASVLQKQRCLSHVV